MPPEPEKSGFFAERPSLDDEIASQAGSFTLILQPGRQSGIPGGNPHRAPGSKIFLNISLEDDLHRRIASRKLGRLLNLPNLDSMRKRFFYFFLMFP